jgi:hypothetical protein
MPAEEALFWFCLGVVALAALIFLGYVYDWLPWDD